MNRLWQHFFGLTSAEHILVKYSDHNYRHFEQKITADIIERCIPKIKIIHEVNVSENPQFKRAHELLVNAERICFLGFGYDKTNLQRLVGKYSTLSNLISPSGKQSCGTAKGFTKAEIKLIIQTQLTGNFFAGDPSWGNLELLRETGILL